MATSKKPSKKVPPKKSSKNETGIESFSLKETGKKIRLTTGMLLVFAGVYVCFAVLGYYFSWQADQDKVMMQDGLLKFIFSSNIIVENWAGRIGAALGHLLVFRSLGVAALFVGIMPVCVGVNLLYKGYVFPIIKALRWFAIFTLIGAPILAYAIPGSEFPWGGAWGNEVILNANQIIGKVGTGMLLFTACCFLLFVIIALDIKPLISRAKNAMAADIKSMTNPLGEDLHTEDEMDEVMNEETPFKDESHLLTQYKSNHGSDVGTDPGNEFGEDEFFDETDDEDDLDSDDGDDEIKPTTPPRSQKKTTAGLSFEVIQQTNEPKITNDRVSVGNLNEPYAPELDLPRYQFPTLDLLEDRNENMVLDKDELEKNKNQIIQTLKSFGIEIQRISATVGPTVTLYEIVPAEGVRISKIRNLEDDIALNLAALGIRIIAPIPGKGTIGIEVPNANKQTVGMKALLSSEKFVKNKMSLPIALGKKIDNENYIVDLATMPHLLLAGATGQGKSVGINAILVSLLYKKHPSQLKFVMVDPKKVELSIYKVIEKHFLAKLPNEEEAIITDTKKVIYTLNALCIEMDNRYELLKEAGARNIKEYNDKFIARKLNPLRGHKFLPFIVLVIDEFADLLMTAGKEVEMPIARLAQLARAVGIHLIIATQRPSVNVITGTIKANFPARIAFKVSAKVDSRTILDTGGAEQLIGRGDMLVSHGSELLRMQCAFVDTPEVEKVVNFIGTQQGYPTAFELPEYEGDDEEGSSKIVDLTNRDKLFEDCAKVVVQTQSGSTSMLQRRFNLGYNRAGRIMDQLEAASIVGPAVGSKPRDVLFHTEAELSQFLSNLS